MKHKKFIALLGIILSGCTSSPPTEDEIRPVLTENVEYFSKRPPLIFSGFSKSQTFINTSFRVGGLIAKLPIKVGDRLNKGDLIAQLDIDDFILHVQKAEASLEEAIAELRKSSAHYKRIKTLYESESASRDELDTARAAFESAQANVDLAQSEVDLAIKDLGYTTLVADQTGCEVAEKKAEINENIKPGETIAMLTCGTTLEVEIAVPESEIANIMQGERVEIYFNTLPKVPFEGFIREVGVSASSGATFPVTILLTKQDSRLRSGMAVKAFVPRPKLLQQEIVVPLEAVGEDQKGTYVYIFEEEGKGIGSAHKVYVKLGDLLPQGVVISSGLEADQELIIAGIRYLADGRKVKRLEDKRLFTKKRS